MDGPDAAVLLEVRRGLRVPILGMEDMRAGLLGARDLGVDEWHGLFAALDIEATGGVGEVVLDVDDEKRGSRVVGCHGLSEILCTAAVSSGSARWLVYQDLWHCYQKSLAPS